MTPCVEFAEPLYVVADSITSVQPVPGGAAITYGVARLVVRENLQHVFRMKYEADTVESAKPVSPTPKLFEPDPSPRPEPGPIPGMNTNKPDRVRKKG